MLSLALRVLLDSHQDTSHFCQLRSCIQTPGPDPACLLTSSPYLLLLFSQGFSKPLCLLPSRVPCPLCFSSAHHRPMLSGVLPPSATWTFLQFLLQRSQAVPLVVFLVTRLCFPQFSDSSVVLGVQSSPSLSLSPRSALNLCGYHTAFL